MGIHVMKKDNRSALYLSKCLCFLIVFLSSAICVQADGDSRKATPEEQAYHRRVQDLFAASLNGNPVEGWETTRQTKMKDLETVGEGSEVWPMKVEYHLEWTDVVRQRQAQEAAMTKISEVAAGSAISDGQMEEYEQLAAKIAEAAASGNIAAIQALQEEMEHKAALMNQKFEAMDEQVASINRAESPTDTYVHLRLFANRLYQDIDPKAERITVAGQPAFRTEGYYSSSGTWNEGSTMVFLGGRWFPPPGESAYQFANEEGAPQTKLQTIVVWLEADPERAAAIFEMIDWRALQGALGQP